MSEEGGGQLEERGKIKGGRDMVVEGVRRERGRESGRGKVWRLEMTLTYMYCTCNVPSNMHVLYMCQRTECVLCTCTCMNLPLVVMTVHVHLCSVIGTCMVFHNVVMKRCHHIP